METSKLYAIPKAVPALIILCMLLLAGCSLARADKAAEIASSAGMTKRAIAAAPFLLTAFERRDENTTTAALYIEGDGKAWLSRRKPSRDPTPPDPVALRLAAQDPSGTVIYIARPCQYSRMLDRDAPCPQAYWTDKRFAPEVIDAYDRALDGIARRHGITGFHLIGFSGGAGVAALLAARRHDVLSLRSVAGNLDHRAHSLHHEVSLLSGSLNPVDQAARLAGIPQRHFIGARDDVVPPQIFESYAAALPAKGCTASRIVEGAAHTEGWEEQWRRLLQEPVICSEAP